MLNVRMVETIVYEGEFDSEAAIAALAGGDPDIAEHYRGLSRADLAREFQTALCHGTGVADRVYLEIEKNNEVTSNLWTVEATPPGAVTPGDHDDGEFTTRTVIASGVLVPGRRVEMTSHLTGIGDTEPFRVVTLSGVFVGDYTSTDPNHGGPVAYFLFRDGHIDGVEQTRFAVPITQFPIYTLTGYGPLTGNAQHTRQHPQLNPTPRPRHLADPVLNTHLDGEGTARLHLSGNSFDGSVG